MAPAAVAAVVVLAGVTLVVLFAGSLHAAGHLPRALIISTTHPTVTPAHPHHHQPGEPVKQHPSTPATASAAPVVTQPQYVVTPNRPVVKDSPEGNEGQEDRHENVRDHTHRGNEGAGDE